MKTLLIACLAGTVLMGCADPVGPAVSQFPQDTVRPVAKSVSSAASLDRSASLGATTTNGRIRTGARAFRVK